MRRTVVALGASVLMGLAGLGMQQAQPPAPAQEKKPQAPAPTSEPKQDKVEFKEILDSWYKIQMSDGSHIGYMHAVLLRMPAGGPGRYEYNVDAETELMVKDLKDPSKEVPSIEAIRIRSHLDDTYSPLDWVESRHLDTSDTNITITQDESGARKIDVSYSSTEHKAYTVMGEDIFFSRFLMFIALRQNGNLARQGPRKASLLYLQSVSAKPSVDIDLSVEPTVKREYLGKKDIPVTKVIYLKPPPARDREFELLETYIDRFGRQVEEVHRNGMKMILVKGEEEAVGKAFLHQGARRDPFRKDLAMKFGVEDRKGGSGPATAPGPIVDPNNFEKSIGDAKNLVAELKKAKDEGREGDGDELYRRILDFHEALKKALLEKQQGPEATAQVEKIRRDAEEIWGGVARLMKKLHKINGDILEAFGRDDVDGMQKGLETLRKSTDAKELREQPQLIELTNMIAKAEPLIAKAKTRLELAKKKLVLTGTTLYEDWSTQNVDGSISFMGVQVGGVQGVRFVRPSRLAIINEKVYRIGDQVEGEGVRVEKIGPNTVQVSLRDETRDVGIRQ